jgi:hypothetical protein
MAISPIGSGSSGKVTDKLDPVNPNGGEKGGDEGSGGGDTVIGRAIKSGDSKIDTKSFSDGMDKAINNLKEANKNEQKLRKEEAKEADKKTAEEKKASESSSSKESSGSEESAPSMAEEAGGMLGGAEGCAG